MENVIELLQNLAVTYGLKVLGAIAIFIIGRWLARFLVDALKKVMKRANIDDTLISFLDNLLYYILLIIVIVTALQALGVQPTSIIAILGAATLAIGLALQDSLGNLSAGIMIILLRPYKVDDFVEINEAQGYVTEIKIFHTRLRTRDNRVVFVPNNDAIDSNIINYSKEEWVRVDLVYGIGYEDDLLKAKRILEEIVQSDERIAQDPAPTVAVQELGDSSVNFAVRPYVKVKDYVPVSMALTEAVKLRFDQEGISIPFPQRDVHLFQAS